MAKWSLALITIGLLMIMIASASQPANLMFVVSGIFYVAVGYFLYRKDAKKKGNR